MSAPTSPRLPTRSAACPACGASFALPATVRCVRCDVDLTHPALAQLLELERRRKVLDQRHATLLAVLTATRARPTSPLSSERIDTASRAAVPPPPPPPTGERTPAPAARAAPPTPVRVPHRSVPTLLVEAYTLAPALTLGAAGIWDLLEDRELRTIPALSPALAVALAPSLVELAREPQALARTLGLVIVAGALAVVATRLRWFAPIVAAATTAVVVALTQLSMVVEVAPRWATFAVVGVLLVYLAATYEKQATRARSLAHGLSGHR